MRTLENYAEAKKLIKLAIYAGIIQIKNGAEIYRAEDTILRICNSAQNVSQVAAHVLPSGIFVSLEFDDEIISIFKNVGSSTINLNKIDQVNTFSRNFVSNEVSLSTAFNILKDIDNKTAMKAYMFNVFAGFCGAFFCILFGGKLKDFIAAYIATFFCSLTLQFFEKYKLNFVVTNFIGAFVITLISTLLYSIHLIDSVDSVIIGSIMIIVPGIAATNAVRDIMNSDFLTGLIGLTKAIFIALGVAIGVGVVLRFLR